MYMFLFLHVYTRLQAATHVTCACHSSITNQYLSAFHLQGVAQLTPGYRGDEEEESAHAVHHKYI